MSASAGSRKGNDIKALQHLAVGVAVAPLLTGCATTTPAPSDSATSSQTQRQRIEGKTYTTWKDDRITESSGLAYLDDTLLTVNDAGGEALIYCSSGTTGEVTGTIRFATKDPVDVEAVTTEPDGTIWVGDVGDNDEKRDSISLFRISPGAPLTGDHSAPAERFKVSYPDGPHNAEAVLVSPETGEVLIVTKSDSGAAVYSAGTEPTDGAVLKRVPASYLPKNVSDGSFDSTGKQVWLRNDNTVSVYSYPGWTTLIKAVLPKDPNGEGLSRGPGSSWLTDSEGVGTTVWQWDLKVPASE